MFVIVELFRAATYILSKVFLNASRELVWFQRQELLDILLKLSVMADRPKVAVVGAGKSTHSSQSNSEVQAKNFIRRVGIRSFEKCTEEGFDATAFWKKRTMLVGYGISQMIQIPPLPQNAGPSQAMLKTAG
jgi:hypothetical protein